MLQIWLVIWVGRSKDRVERFQFLLLMKFATDRAPSRWVRGPQIRDLSGVFGVIHESCQKFTKLPLYIFQRALFWQTDQPCMMLRHMKEEWFDRLVLDLQYLEMRVEAQKLTEEWYKRHASAACKALFLTDNLWRPKPPCDLGVVTTSHLLRCNHFLWSVVPQRKFRWQR